jgi:O-antigen/teichoic acid export membrane protein
LVSRERSIYAMVIAVVLAVLLVLLAIFWPPPEGAVSTFQFVGFIAIIAGLLGLICWTIRKMRHFYSHFLSAILGATIYASLANWPLKEVAAGAFAFFYQLIGGIILFSAFIVAILYTLNLHRRPGDHPSATP